MPGRLILLDKAGKTAYLKKQFFAPNFYNIKLKNMKKFALLFKLLSMGVFEVYGFGGQFAAVWELWPILELNCGSFLPVFEEKGQTRAKISDLKWTTAPKRLRSDPHTHIP